MANKREGKCVAYGEHGTSDAPDDGARAECGSRSVHIDVLQNASEC